MKPIPSYRYETRFLLIAVASLKMLVSYESCSGAFRGGGGGVVVVVVMVVVVIVVVVVVVVVVV